MAFHTYVDDEYGQNRAQDRKIGRWPEHLAERPPGVLVRYGRDLGFRRASRTPAQHFYFWRDQQQMGIIIRRDRLTPRISRTASLIFLSCETERANSNRG
jgi:hypothetical protein